MGSMHIFGRNFGHVINEIAILTNYIHFTFKQAPRGHKQEESKVESIIYYISADKDCVLNLQSFF